MVHDTGGIHAQVQASAELQLAVRVDGITQQDVRDALWERRELVKAWTLRGTLHLHPADELPLWYAAGRAVSPGEPQGLEAWVDPKGELHAPLGAEDVKEIRAAVLDTLDGRCLLREELAAEVVQRVGLKAKGRLLSGFAFFGGAVLCQGPPQGSKITLARPDQWVEGWEEVDEQESLREVCRRYLRTHGPATPKDFREWFTSRQFKSADARALFDSMGNELEAVDVEGHAASVLAGDTDFPQPEASVRLLPEYDVYVMGFRQRDQLVPEEVRAQVAVHGRGKYEGPAGVRFLMVDGIAAGLWERKKRGKRIELQVTPSRKLMRGERAELDTEVERAGAFLGLEPMLTIE
ncbi:MAG: winged helix DNA-binding domain-containing protein [Actinomycetota bacterium]|nr:winged helix DNA-binding domain-containing protein [Actinomycetota bacterium]